MVFSLFTPLHKGASLSTLVVALGFASAALAQNDSIYGNTYSPVPNAVPEQAQVVQEEPATQPDPQTQRALAELFLLKAAQAARTEALQ